MNETITTTVAEIATLKGETPVEQAWAEICRILPRDLAWPNRRRTGWRRTHYADCNANGSNKMTGDLPCLYLGDPDSGRKTEGGQNSGSYYYHADDDDCLCFASDGCIYEVKSIDGSWSQWQGSSSSYSYQWRVYAGAVCDEAFGEVVAKVIELLTTHRDNLRHRHAAGAGVATKLLTALRSL